MKPGVPAIALWSVCGLLAAAAPWAVQRAAAATAGGPQSQTQTRVLGGAAPGAGASYARFLDDLAMLAPDSTQVAEVASVEIERDAGAFVLEQGTLVLCQPVAGRV